MTDTANLSSATVYISSFTFSVLSALVSGSSAMTLGRSVFSRYSQAFVATDSTLRFITFRLGALLVASMLLFCDSVSQSVFFLSLWRVGTANFYVTRLVYIACFPCTGAIMTFATCLRCAVIVTSNPVLTRRLLLLCAVLCLSLACFAMVSAFLLLMELIHKDPTAQGRIWATTVYIPVLSSYFTGMNPVLATVMSIWALSASILGQTRPPTTRQFSSRLVGTAKERHPFPNQPSGSLPPSESNMPHDPISPDKGADSPATFSPKTQLAYPLSATFVLLTVFIVSLWTMVIVFHLVLGPYVGPVRTNVMASFLASLCVAAETSFERLLRKVSHHRAKRNNGGHHFFGTTMLGAGGRKLGGEGQTIDDKGPF